MVFFPAGGQIRPPALDGVGASNNVATRLARHRHSHTQSRDHRPYGSLPALQRQHQQRNTSSHGAIFVNSTVPGLDTQTSSSWLAEVDQPALAPTELPVITHPAGNHAAAAPAKPSSAGSTTTGSQRVHVVSTADSKASSSSSNTNTSSSSNNDSSSSSSSSSHASSSALPEQLLQLVDASLPVMLPPPSSVPPGTLDNRELDKLVGSLGRNKATWRRALVLSQWLQESGHVLDDRLCTTLIRVCSEHGQAVTALSVYEWMKAPALVGGAGLGPTVYTYTAAMRAALAAGLLDRALQVWEDAQAAQCQLDCRLCITYIEVCSRKGLTSQALAMYAAMKAAPKGSKLAPTVHAYTAAMRAATEGGLWAKALDIWTDMKAAGVAPTGHAFAAAMSACAAGSNWQQAVVLFEDMCQAGIKPDVVSCTALISALASAGQWQRGEAVVQWMLTTGVRPNVRTFTALLTALGNARQWDRAFEMLSLMQHSSWGGVAPNAYTYTALLKSLGECGEWQRAERLFAMLERQALQQASPAASSSNRSGSSAAGAAAAATIAAVGGAAWQQPQAVVASSSSSATPAAAVAGPGAEVAPGVWGWQAAGSRQGLIQRPSNWGDEVNASSSITSHVNGGLFGPVLGVDEANKGSAVDAALRPPPQQQQQQHKSSAVVQQQEQDSLWTSASQLHGLDLNLQLQREAATTGSGAGSSSSNNNNAPGSIRSSSPIPPGGIAGSSSSSSKPELQQLQALQQLPDSAAAVEATRVNTVALAQQLAQLALQQQIAANMDLQLIMHQQHAQAMAASHRVQQQQQQQQLQQQARTQPPSGPLRTRQLQQQQWQRQQQQLAADAAGHRHGGGPGGLVNETVVNSLMLAYEKAGKWQECVGALARGAALGVPLTATMYSTAISAAGQAGQLAVADALFAQSRAAGTADRTTYETFVAVLGMAGDPARAEVALRAMQAAGFQSGDYAYCGLIAGYSLIGDAAAAQRVRTRIVREQGPGAVSVHVYNALLAAADRAGAYDKALELLRCMRREGVEPNALTQQLAAEVGRKGQQEVEGQQLTAAALSAAMAAAGTLLMRSGVW